MFGEIQAKQSTGNVATDEELDSNLSYLKLNIFPLGQYATEYAMGLKHLLQTSAGNFFFRKIFALSTLITEYLNIWSQPNITMICDRDYFNTTYNRSLQLIY